MCFGLCPYPSFSKGYLPGRFLLLKTFSFPHVLFIKYIISTAGSRDEWQKLPAGNSRKGSRREQGDIFFRLFRTLKSNLLLAIWAKESSSQQLLIWEAPTSFPWPGVTDTSQACLGMGWHEGVALLFLSLMAGFGGGGLFQMAEKVIVTFSNIFFVVDGHFLVIAAPGFFLFLLLLPSPSGVLVTQLGVGGFDSCQLPQCKYSYLGYQPDVSEYGIGKTQDMCVIAFQEPARSLFQQHYTAPCLTYTVSRGYRSLQTSTLSFCNWDFRIWFVKSFCICYAIELWPHHCMVRITMLIW